MVLVSALAGAATLWLVWSERYGLARVSSALAVVAIVVGWALAQNPYLLPPGLTLDDAARRRRDALPPWSSSSRSAC